MVSTAVHARQMSGLEASTSGRCASYVTSHAIRPPVVKQWQQHVSSPQLRTFCAAAAAAKGPSAPQRQNQIQHPRTDLPSGDFSRVKKSIFVSSSVDLRGCPPQDYPEFAVIGRSNVGKSSLINMLTQNSKLAKVSKEPGGHGRCRCWHCMQGTAHRVLWCGQCMPSFVCLCAGMTKTINHFLINDSWYLVDLPGYG
eukprot:GHRQ01024499.1.p1 GENE.GHRQ01024499.1~~GHRQ01024499.1.p1  ORF type:complete len:197 (+),score=2.84 GHRQ01024499.1:93-683(+)